MVSVVGLAPSDANRKAPHMTVKTTNRTMMALETLLSKSEADMDVRYDYARNRVTIVGPSNVTVMQLMSLMLHEGHSLWSEERAYVDNAIGDMVIKANSVEFAAR